MSDHSIFAPSSFEQLAHCPGSVPLQLLYPETGETEHAQYGTAAHWWGAQAMPVRSAAGWTRPAEPPVGSFAPNGVLIDEAIAQGAGMWADYVERLVEQYGSGVELYVEQPVEIHRVHELCWGTPDTVVWVPWRKLLVVVDFKFGFGLVEAIDNWQVAGYAMGWVDKLIAATPGLQDQHITVQGVIIQPRANHPQGPVREWKFPATDLRPMANILGAMAHEAMLENPTYRTGPGCTHCRGRHACSALQAAGFNSREYVSRFDSQELSPAALALEMFTLETLIDLAKARLSGLVEHATALERRGQGVPGYSMQQGRGNRRWTKPAEEVFALGDMFGIELRKKAEPITPTQAIKLIDESVISQYSQRYPGEMKLARNDEKLIQQVFKK